MPADNIFQLRRGSATQWSSSTTALNSGEPGYDTTNNILKIGDGNSLWSSLTEIGSNLSDTTIVRNTGNQNISGIKTFFDSISLTGISNYDNNNIQILTSGTNRITILNNGFVGIGTTSPAVRLHVNGDTRVVGNCLVALNTQNAPSNRFSIGLRSSASPLNTISFLPSGLSNATGITSIISISSGVNTIYLPSGGPNGDGTLALLSNINTSQLTGILSTDKGGTGRSSYNNGELLIGSGNTLVASTLTSGTGIFVNNEAGKVTINITGIDLSLIPGLSGYFSDNLNTSLVQSTGIGLTYNSSSQQLLIGVTGISTNLINDFNSSVSGLLPKVFSTGLSSSTNTTLLTASMPSGSSSNFNVRVSAYNTATSGAASWNIRGLAARKGSNNTVLIGSNLTDRWYDASLENSVINVSPSSTNLVVQASGFPADNTDIDIEFSYL